MIAVSGEYSKAALESERYVSALAEVVLYDTSMKSTVTPTANTTEGISDVTQLVNDARYNKKFASFEPTYFKLDGTFDIAPTASDEIGWWSDTLCDSAGEWTTNPLVTLTLSSTDSTKTISVLFDSLQNQYATDFEVKMYNGATLLNTYNVTDNDKNSVVITVDDDDYTIVTIEIEKWVTGERRARIVEVDFGFAKVYNDDGIVNINVLEEISATGIDFPANELQLEVINEDNLFNPLNDNGIYDSLKAGFPINCRIGLITDAGLEYCTMGEYFLKTWDVQKSDLTIEFTARNIIDTLDSKLVHGNDAWFNNPQYTIDNVMGEAGITEYSVSSILNSVDRNVFFHIYLKEIKLRKLLQQMFIMYFGVVYADRDNFLYFSDKKEEETNLKILLSNIIKKPKIITQNNISKVILNGKRSAPTGDPTDVNFHNLNVLLSERTVFWLNKTQSGYGATYNITNGTLNDNTEYAWNSLLDITPDSATTAVGILLPGIVGPVIGGVIGFSDETASYNNNGSDGVTVNCNLGYCSAYFDAVVSVLDTRPQGEKISQWIFDNYNKYQYEIDWQQNPAFETGDIVELETDFGYKKAKIIKQEFRYNGGLTGKTILESVDE